VRVHRIRGAVISSEAILYSAVISVLIVLAFWYISSYLAQPKYVQGYVDAKYCGSVLTVKNVGSIAVRIDRIIGVYSNGTSTVIQVGINLNPGETWYSNNIGSFSSVTVVGDNFAPVTAKNECV